jgi:hypothetical protein
VTRAEGNVLFELDGRSALALYERYLGEHASALPGSGLRFPLCVSWGGGGRIVRTVLGVDRAAQSMTFAGDVAQGSVARLMTATIDRLVDGAGAAAAAARRPGAGLAILISCVGRRQVMGQRVEEETEEVARALGGAALTGFYSYGEICPAAAGAPAELHNQTMTITTIWEP